MVKKGKHSGRKEKIKNKEGNSTHKYPITE